MVVFVVREPEGCSTEVLDFMNLFLDFSADVTEEISADMFLFWTPSFANEATGTVQELYERL